MAANIGSPSPGAGAGSEKGVGPQQGELGGDVAAKESCIKYVDAIWFCYSPVFQSTKYYREGTFDSCLGKWGDLWDCIRLRTSAAPAVLAKREAARKDAEAQGQRLEPIWELRSAAESEAFWTAEFHSRQAGTSATAK